MWTNRRQVIRSFVTGTTLFPALVSQLLAESEVGSSRKPQFQPRAKRVIFLFMSGGVSHVDTWDPKPLLARDHGKEVKLNHPEIENRPGYERIFLKRPDWEFKKHGQSGTEVSSLFPHMASCVDDLALIRSMHT
ncbi:MAG: DUF1501 domain-containing protein, partial [Planctomycetia bacterium]